MTQAIIVLAIVGFLMIAAEVFIPGLVLGILGGLCLITSVVFCYMAFGPLVGTIAFAVLSLLTMGGLFIWLNVFPRTSLGKKIMLRSSLTENTSLHSPSLIGAEGQAVTPLRPAGTALINGHRIDVVAESRFIDPGEQITVILQEGVRVVVQAKNR